MAHWRIAKCFNCGGVGIAAYPEGIVDDCTECDGWGQFIASKGGAIAHYLGGPLVGFDRALFAECDPATEFDTDAQRESAE